MTPKFHHLSIKDIRRETKDTVSIAFQIPESLSADYQYLSGQYLTLKADIGAEEVRRSYSLCSSPFEGEWRVAVKQIENGKFSTFANKSLKAGDTLEVMQPMGNFKFTPEESVKKNYVLFAAGSGITPIFSILKSILKDEPQSTVTLFYGNKGFYGIIFREELEGWKNKYIDRFRLVHVFSRESPGNKIQKGRIDAEKCNDLYNAFLKNEQIDAAYICGPEQMILSVKNSLEQKGIPPENIHFELFGTQIKTETKSTSENLPSFDSKVEVIVDGDIVEFDLDSNGLTILDAAQKAGADLPFACKGGVCCTCKAKVLEGSARMDVNYALTPEEVENNYILTCQAHPTSEQIVVSFDD
jgi:ring-1,2-phenylacetyl-CoA epoxidase subunit PaaE